MSTIISLSPWSSVWWGMGKGSGTSSVLIAEKVLEKLDTPVLRFVEDDSPCDEGNIAIPVHFENLLPNKMNYYVRRICDRLGCFGQDFIFEIEKKMWCKYNRKFFKYVMNFLKKRNINSVSLVYCHSSFLVMCAKLLGETFKCPVVSHFYGTFLSPCIGKGVHAYQKYAKEYLGWMTHVDLRICLNDGTQGLEVAKDLRLPLEKFLFQPHGLDIYKLNSFIDTSLVKELISDDVAYVMTASRLVHWKRVDRLLLAIPHIVEQIKKVRFLILGDGPELKKLEHLVRELNITEYVKFLGSLPQESVLAFMRKCDLFVSTNDHSNLSEGLKQAMYLEMCILAADTGDTRTLIKDGITGKLVPPDNEIALAKAIIQILSNPEMKYNLGHSAKTFINSTELTQETIMAERISVLKTLMNNYKKLF